MSDTAPLHADVLLVHGEAASAREAYREQGEGPEVWERAAQRLAAPEAPA
ncbi:hypothetical protein ACFWEB_15730 [Streptomyces parvus]